jgi:hypothetical protein
MFGQADVFVFLAVLALEFPLYHLIMSAYKANRSSK